MNDVTPFTLWNAETGEITQIGSSPNLDMLVVDGLKIHWGEHVDHETMIFDIETELPIERSSPLLISPDIYGVLTNRERQRRIELGQDFGGIWLTGSDKDQTNLMGLGRKAEKLKAAGVTAAVIPFRDGKNVIHYLTPNEMLDLEEQGAYFVSLCYQASWALKDMAAFPQDIGNDEYWP